MKVIETGLGCGLAQSTHSSGYSRPSVSLSGVSSSARISVQEMEQHWNEGRGSAGSGRRGPAALASSWDGGYHTQQQQQRRGPGLPSPVSAYRHSMHSSPLPELEERRLNSSHLLLATSPADVQRAAAATTTSKVTDAAIHKINLLSSRPPGAATLCPETPPESSNQLPLPLVGGDDFEGGQGEEVSGETTTEDLLSDSEFRYDMAAYSSTVSHPASLPSCDDRVSRGGRRKNVVGLSALTTVDEAVSEGCCRSGGSGAPSK